MQEGHTRAHDFPAPAPGPSRSLIANDKIEQLIEEVEKRPALYKKNIKQYSDINLKKKLWEEVCEVLINNWGALDVNERKQQGHDIQRKWNNLRTCFARELKAQKSVKSGQAASKRRPYVYYERMLFLAPCMESRPTEGSIENAELNQDVTDISEETQSQSQRKRKTKQSDFDEQILKALQSSEDHDTNYCLSLVPFMKELTSDEKLEVRIRILQIFQDMKKSRLLPNTFSPHLPDELQQRLFRLFLIKLFSNNTEAKSIPQIRQFYHSIRQNLNSNLSLCHRIPYHLCSNFQVHLQKVKRHPRNVQHHLHMMMPLLHTGQIFQSRRIQN